MKYISCSLILSLMFAISLDAKYRYIKSLHDVTLQDIALVGGKNASLGEMITQLTSQNILVPSGFAITVDAYWHFLQQNNLIEQIRHQLAALTDTSNLAQLKQVASSIRLLIENGTIPDDLAHEISNAYKELSIEYYQPMCDVAVRSSATAEDLPNASFAGQQDTYLHVQGAEQVLAHYKKCLASLFTDRAIAYRIEQNFDHLSIALSVGIQKMVRSDLSCSGVAFSLDTESGFKDVITINASYGLGEGIVQGAVNPDEFIVFKTTLAQGFAPIIKKECGSKKTKMVYNDGSDGFIKTVNVPKNLQSQFCLTDPEILELAKTVMKIEQHYSNVYGKPTAMDIEWAKNGRDGKMYIIQARPETIHTNKQHENVIRTYELKDDRQKIHTTLLASGISIGQKIAHGTARIIGSIEEIGSINSDDIIVTDMTDPDWVPVMRHTAGIVTNRGGRTCHAAIVSRELGITAIVGTEHATENIHDGEKITLDCSTGNKGYVYPGHIPFSVSEIKLNNLPQSPVTLMVNLADPDSAFKISMLPTNGVGLVRLEFVIGNTLQIHPMALIHPERIQNPEILTKIEKLTAAYKNKPRFFVEQLAHKVGMIAAAFYPRPIIVRFSDFKSNEYRNLIGGIYFEPEEENPMIGFRGASRYYHPNYQEAFALECEAMRIVREHMGLTNVKLMIPFCRTLKEAEAVINEMKKNGLERGKNELEVIMMCEIPSNVLLMKEFSNYFDGFSIGSNDLTQTTLGIDRDSELVAPIFDERDPAVKRILTMALNTANSIGAYIGICGQAPSDFPELAQFLIDNGIQSLSLTSDTVIPFLLRYAQS